MIDHAQRHSGPRSKLEVVFVGLFLAAWLAVFGMTIGQALLYHFHQAVFFLRGGH